jgi:hypothetical protein
VKLVFGQPKHLFKNTSRLSTRVTRLGDFSPIGRLFRYFWRFYENTHVPTYIAQSCLLLISIVTYVLILTKNGLGYLHCGCFLTNSAGHSASYLILVCDLDHTHTYVDHIHTPEHIIHIVLGIKLFDDFRFYLK